MCLCGEERSKPAVTKTRGDTSSPGIGVCVFVFSRIAAALLDQMQEIAFPLLVS